MERNQFNQLLTRTAVAGAKNALALCDNQPDAITKSQAYRLYGRSDVDRWLSEKLLIPNTQNRLDKAVLAHIASRSNRATYLPKAER